MSGASLRLTPDDLILSDFDGTISLIDTGLAMIDALGEEASARAWDLEYQWRRGEIDSMTCLSGQWRLWDKPPAALYALIDTLQLDEGFRELLDLARARGAGVAVLSDGLEFYIDRLLAKWGVETCAEAACLRSRECLVRRANRAVIGESGLAFEYPNRGECGLCGNCKALHLFEFRPGFRRTIYLGDGHSDLCAARYADIIFARGALAEDCARAGRRFFPFQSFADVLAVLR